MTKRQEFRKQTEEAKFISFSFMCKKVVELEEKNAELKEQIEKMKCCENCKYSTLDLCEHITCGLGYGDDFEPKCENLKRWELAE